MKKEVQANRFTDLKRDPRPPLMACGVTISCCLPEWVVLAENDTVEWYGAADDGNRRVTYSPKCLFDLIALVDQPAEAVARFVEKWGPLAVTPEICEDARVADREQASSYKIMPEGTQIHVASFYRVFREPLQGYYDYARYARALLNIASATSANEIPSKADRDLAFSNIQVSENYKWDLWSCRNHLAEAVDEWLASAGVYPSLIWTRGQYVLSLSYVPNPLHVRGWDMARESGTPFYWRRVNTETKCIDPVVAPRPSYLLAALGIEIAKIVLSPLGHRRCKRCQDLFCPRHGGQELCGVECVHEAEKEQKRNSWHKKHKKV